MAEASSAGGFFMLKGIFSSHRLQMLPHRGVSDGWGVVCCNLSRGPITAQARGDLMFSTLPPGDSTQLQHSQRTNTQLPSLGKRLMHQCQ